MGKIRKGFAFEYLVVGMIVMLVAIGIFMAKVMGVQSTTLPLCVAVGIAIALFVGSITSYLRRKPAKVRIDEDVEVKSAIWN